MPKGEMFTAAYYIRSIFAEILSLLDMEWRGERKLIVHVENARPHIAK
jgi:hypothetical protein